MRFKVGDRVKLKSYIDWCDYATHNGQTAEIIRIVGDDYFDWKVEWSDKTTSNVRECNLIMEYELKKEIKMYGIAKFCMENYK